MKNLRFCHLALVCCSVLSLLFSIRSSPAQNSNCVLAADGLVGIWRGDGSAADGAGTNYGTTPFGIAYASGVVGTAFDFNGSQRRVTIADSADLILTNSLTIEGWVFPRQRVSGFICFRGDNRPGLDAWTLDMYQSGFLNFQIDDAQNNFVSLLAPIQTNQWQHIAATLDSASGSMRLYINGVLLAETNTAIRPIGQLDPAYAPAVGIGNHGATFHQFPFDGLIDEISIYSRALSQNEIVAVYNAGTAGKCEPGTHPPCIPAPAGAIGWWKGDGSAADYAGANAGVMMNGGSYSGAKVGGGFQFDGTNQCVQIPYSPALITSNFTVEGWIRPDAQVSDAINQEVIFGQSYGALQMVVRKGTSGLLVAWQFGTDHFNFYGVQSTVEIPIGEFTHVAGTWDGTTLSLFINGVLNAQSLPGVSPADSGCDFSIGGFYNPAANNCQYVGQFFSGLVDEVTLYNRALDAAEVTDIYRSGSGGKCHSEEEQCVLLPPDAVGLWRGDGNASDSVGVNHGQGVGGLTYQTGMVGGAFSVGQNQGLVRIPDSPLWAFGTNQFTVELWANFSQLASSPIEYPHGGVLIGHDEGPFWVNKWFFAWAGGVLSFHINDPVNGPVWIAQTPFSPEINRWYHLGITRSGGTFTVYIDGVAAGSGSSTRIVPDANAFLTIGESEGFYFNGLIDEVSIYHRALSGTEMKAIFDSKENGKCVAPLTPFLINVDYGAGTNGTTKKGFAALGSTTNDFWNFYTRDGVGGVMRTFGALSNLSLVDGTATSVGMTVANGPGMWGNGSTDPMYFSYIYPFDSGNLIVTFTNLPPGRYDVLPYCFDGNYEVTVGGTSYGIRTTRDYPVVNPPVWTEGLQFARFTNVLVQSGQPLILTVRPGIDGYAVLSGIQLLRTSTNPPAAPFITQQPASRTLWVGTNVAFSVTAGGDAPLFYQWLYNGTNLPGKTSSTLSLMNVQLSDSGHYSVIITNFAGAITSQIAVLTVKLPPSCSPPASGLVSHWRFENNILDTWGENHGMLSGRGAPFDTGKSGRALWATTPLIVLDDPSLDLTNAFTLEAWVRPSTLSITTPQTILAKFENITAVPLGMQSSFYLGLTNNGSPFLVVSGSGSVRTNVNLVAPIRIPANAWTHLGATYDGASLRIYTNGVLVASNSYSGGVFASSTDLTIGGLTGGLSRSFNGLLDEVAIYNRALNQDEILAAYESDFTGKCVVGPEITANPLSQAIPEGEDVRLTVSAAGTKPFRYQWRFNGTNIASATNAALVIEKAAPGHAGFYSVAVSNSAGSDLSASAQLKLLPAPSCVAAPEGVISWWPMDGNANDVVGPNLSTASGVTYPTGKVGRALAITFSIGRVWVPQPASSLNFGTNQSFSIEVWVKASSSSNPSAMPFMTIVEKRSSPFNGTGYMMGLWNGRLAFALGSTVVSPTNSSLVRAAGPDLRDDIFHHLAVTVQRGATNGGTLFVDGEVVATFDTSIPRNGSSSGSFYIGAPGQVFLDASPLFGIIDEMAIYNRALSAAEVESIAAAGAVGKCKLPPTIITQPMDQTVKVSSNAVFTVLASGTPTLRYWWWKGSQPLPVSTNSTLTLSNVQLSAAGAYRVVVTNGFGAVTSSIANLLVQQLVPPVNGGQMRLEAADGHPVIRFSGVPGQQYTIQASTNLVDWVNVGVASDLGDGIFEFTDPDARSRDALFYRVVGP